MSIERLAQIKRAVNLVGLEAVRARITTLGDREIFTRLEEEFNKKARSHEDKLLAEAGINFQPGDGKEPEEPVEYIYIPKAALTDFIIDMQQALNKYRAAAV
jgi:hypothetical protein